MVENSAIDVCICTFRRPSLEHTLRSIANQKFVSREIAVRVIIADNDHEPSARLLVHRICCELGARWLYVHAPAQNISIARNICLEVSDAPLLAFIDDDEEAAPQWLQCLLADLEAQSLDVVFGPVRAIYTPELADWICEADLHSTRPVVSPSGEIDTGYTCNVMLRRKRVGSRRFDVALGRSGGEDTEFFHALMTDGARLGFSPAAEVTEIVTPHRASLRWLVRRSFRAGQSHARNLLKTERRAPQVAIAAAKAFCCLLLTGANFRSPAGWRRAAVRGALHVGVVARLLGIRDLRLY